MKKNIRVQVSLTEEEEKIINKYAYYSGIAKSRVILDFLHKSKFFILLNNANSLFEELEKNNQFEVIDKECFEKMILNKLIEKTDIKNAKLIYK